jgi:hypothetical protein
VISKTVTSDRKSKLITDLLITDYWVEAAILAKTRVKTIYCAEE